jgi:hypothetical protein
VGGTTRSERVGTKRPHNDPLASFLGVAGGRQKMSPAFQNREDTEVIQMAAQVRDERAARSVHTKTMLYACARDFGLDRPVS